MAWYNPATWTPVDYLQENVGNLFEGGTVSSPVGIGTSNLGTNEPTTSGTSDAQQFVNDMYPYSPAANQTTDSSDPYAQWGGKENYDALVSGFNTQKENIFSTSQEAAANAARSRKSSILDFIQGLVSGQQTLDERGVQNELAKKQGMGSIFDMVGRGIKSGQSLLANRNASDSSASEQLARAYANLGNREAGKIGNQYELEGRNLGLAQKQFNTQRDTGLRKFEEDKVAKVNTLVSTARQLLTDLDAQIANASLPERINIEAEKEKIKAQVLETLSQYDQRLSEGASGVNPTSADERRRTAFGLANQGVAANQPFQFSTEAPTQFQGAESPAMSFIASRYRREQ